MIFPKPFLIVCPELVRAMPGSARRRLGSGILKSIQKEDHLCQGKHPKRSSSHASLKGAGLSRAARRFPGLSGMDLVFSRQSECPRAPNSPKG